MSASVISNLPSFDTGQYESCDFLMSGGGATLTLQIAGLRPQCFRFSTVRWHQFTSAYNCTPEMVKDAYFRLVEYKQSSAVANFIEQDQASSRPYETLSHYRIFLDGTGCHEVFAEEVTAL